MDVQKGRGIPDPRRSRLWLGGLATFAAAGAAGLVAAQAPKTPGAVGVVAGHTPSQFEQAQTAPVSDSEPGPDRRDWWSPGEGRVLAAQTTYANPWGRGGIVNTGGPVITRGHAFFEAIGENGRACVSCHQPADNMSLSADSVRQRWRETGGKDPIFVAVDGANCPTAAPGAEASHSLLLNRGLFRVFLPWPPRARDGSPMDPEFTLEVVRDPTGCNTDPTYGLKSANPMVSVYRRPRPLANMRYVLSTGFGVGQFVGKDGSVAAVDPETGRPVNMNMMADARHPTLKTQAVEAAITHLQFKGRLSEAQLQQIVAFEQQIYAAQAVDRTGGPLDQAGGPPGLGPQNMSKGGDGLLGNNTSNYVVPMGEAWKRLARTGDAAADRRAAFRESVQRGHDVFHLRTFWIRDAMHINTVGLGNPTKRTCSTCHGGHMTGMDSANGWMDIGTTNLPWAKEEPQSPWNSRKPELPLFKLTCKASVAPHPYLGRTIYTQDPGRALISGRCNDIGTIVIQQIRGLAGRAPYFSNGSASDLREVVDFYDRRFNIGYSEQEKTDLINFLSVL